MKLLVEFSEKPSCYASLHSSDASELFRTPKREFCRTLRLQRASGDVFVGWVGDNALTRGRLVLSKTFAECLGLEEGEQVDAFSHAAPVAKFVMVQPQLAKISCSKRTLFPPVTRRTPKAFVKRTMVFTCFCLGGIGGRIMGLYTESPKN